MLDPKLKEPGKEVKNSKEVKDGKEFKPEGSATALKAPEKSDKTPKGKTFYTTMSFITFVMDTVYKCSTVVAEFNDYLLSLLFTKCSENN